MAYESLYNWLPGVEGGFDWLGRAPSTSYQWSPTDSTPINTTGMSPETIKDFGLANTDAGSGGLMNMFSGPNASFNMESMKNWGTILGGIGSIYDAYGKNKYANLLGDQLNENKRQFNLNYNQQAEATRRGVEARMDANYAARPVGYKGRAYTPLKFTTSKLV